MFPRYGFRSHSLSLSRPSLELVSPTSFTHHSNLLSLIHRPPSQWGGLVVLCTRRKQVLNTVRARARTRWLRRRHTVRRRRRLSRRVFCLCAALPSPRSCRARDGLPIVLTVRLYNNNEIAVLPSARHRKTITPRRYPPPARRLARPIRASSGRPLSSSWSSSSSYLIG